MLTHIKSFQYSLELVNHLFTNKYSVVTGEGGRPARTRTLSQSSYTDANETNMIIFQQPSPLHPTYWTPAPTPGDSAASSVANTPVLQRKRRDSKVAYRTTSVCLYNSNKFGPNCVAYRQTKCCVLELKTRPHFAWATMCYWLIIIIWRGNIRIKKPNISPHCMPVTFLTLLPAVGNKKKQPLRLSSSVIINRPIIYLSLLSVSQ